MLPGCFRSPLCEPPGYESLSLWPRRVTTVPYITGRGLQGQKGVSPSLKSTDHWGDNEPVGGQEENGSSVPVFLRHFGKAQPAGGDCRSPPTAP